MIKPNGAKHDNEATAIIPILFWQNKLDTKNTGSLELVPNTTSGRNSNNRTVSRDGPLQQHHQCGAWVTLFVTLLVVFHFQSQRLTMISKTKTQGNYH